MNQCWSCKTLRQFGLHFVNLQVLSVGLIIHLECLLNLTPYESLLQRRELLITLNLNLFWMRLYLFVCVCMCVCIDTSISVSLLLVLFAFKIRILTSMELPFWFPEALQQYSQLISLFWLLTWSDANRENEVFGGSPLKSCLMHISAPAWSVTMLYSARQNTTTGPLGSHMLHPLPILRKPHLETSPREVAPIFSLPHTAWCAFSLPFHCHTSRYGCSLYLEA